MRPLAQQAVAAFPSLRRAVAKSRSVGARAPIDPAAIEASVTRSLRFLGTDYIDVLAVHEPTLRDATNADVFNVMQRLVERGLVRAISVAGDPQTIEAAVRTSDSIDIAQFPDTPFTNSAQGLRARLPVLGPIFVTHGVFGSGVIQALIQALARVTAQQQARIATLAERHGIDVSKSPIDLLLPFAFSNNPDGVVIVSMFDTKHIERNIAASCLQPIPGFAGPLRESLA